MALILRVDVDKPFGKHTLIRRVFSKIKEDYFLNLTERFGYLDHLKAFIHYCNKMEITATFFHRLCTTPDSETLSLLLAGDHRIGLHLENSRSKESLFAELDALQKRVKEFQIISFSKHGSGVYKLGKYHYPKYEPELYNLWSQELGYKFHSGNGIPESAKDLYAVNGYFENIFWIEPEYRSPKFYEITYLVDVAKANDVVVLIHPCNYMADETTRNDFHKLVELAKAHNVGWKLLI